jgi:hypothetical protein
LGSPLLQGDRDRMRQAPRLFDNVNEDSEDELK